MAQYRKKPVVIDAWQFTGDINARGVCTCGERAKPHLHTMHDGQAVDLVAGDWIVPEPMADRFYPVKPDHFAKTYDPVLVGGEITDLGGRDPRSVVPPPAPVEPGADLEFRKGLESLLNSHSRENGSNTPDFILAQFLCGVLAAWDAAVMRRSEWYGGKDRII